LPEFSKKNLIPLYHQVEINLRHRIKSSEFKVGDIIPSEEALGKEYNVSRITVRQAMAKLEEDGLIKRQRGKGTFVVKKDTDITLNKSIGPIEYAIFKGLGPKYEIRLLKSEPISVPESAAAALEIEENEQVWGIVRVRLVDGKPMGFITNYLPMDIGSRLNPEDIEKRPILNSMETRLGITLVEAEQLIDATIADAHLAELLEIRVGDPLLRLVRNTYDSTGRPVNHALMLIRADRYSFRVKLRKTTTSKDMKKGWKVE
jgi:GntR family transcriptional regulator